MLTKPTLLCLCCLLFGGSSLWAQDADTTKIIVDKKPTSKICLDCEGGGGGGGGTVVTCTSNTVLYVDGSRPNNNGDGFSWATAKKYLQAALYIANRCTAISEVRVAEGKYTASTTASVANRDNNFFIGESYNVLGGYPAGGGTRDHVANPTILDGEIQDLYEAYHVVVVYGVSGSITIDGFQIKNGFAEGTGSIALEPGVNMDRNDGAGIYLRDANNITIRNCAIYTNVANDNGGGIYSNNSDPKLINTVVANNTAAGSGGGFYNAGGSIATITNATFCNNNNFTTGGAIYCNTGSEVNLVNSVVWGNSSAWGGGGDRNVSYSLVQNGSMANNSLAADAEFNNTADLNGADNTWFTGDDGLAPRSCSPAINRGSNPANTLTTDIAGNTRKYNTAIDMGAYELQSIPLPVSGTLSLNNDTADTWVYGGATLLGQDCRTIAQVEPNGFSPFSGKVTAKTYISSGSPTYNGQPWLTRHYAVNPTQEITPETMDVTLFFTNTEFNNYNLRADVIKPLPTTAGANKANLRVVRYGGTSATGLPGSYSGAYSLIDPDDADIVWDVPRLHWRVSFSVAAGSSGYFVTTPVTYRFTGTGNWTDVARWDAGQTPPASLPSYCEVVIAAGAACTLNVAQTISKDAKLTVETGGNLKVNGNLTIVK